MMLYSRLCQGWVGTKLGVCKMKLCGCRLRQTWEASYTGAIVDRAPVAQLDRASGYEPEGREFESLRAHHFFPKPSAPSKIAKERPPGRSKTSHRVRHPPKLRVPCSTCSGGKFFVSSVRSKHQSLVWLFDEVGIAKDSLSRVSSSSLYQVGA